LFFPLENDTGLGIERAANFNVQVGGLISGDGHSFRVLTLNHTVGRQIGRFDAVASGS
jgi:hypothetical protein